MTSLAELGPLIGLGLGALNVWLVVTWVKHARAEYGHCDCGGVWMVRTNKRTGEQFLGCSNFRHGTCDRTKELA